MSKGDSKQTVQTTLDPEFETYRNQIFNRARGVADQGYTPYNGQTVAGIDPLTRQGVTGLQGAQSQYDLLRQMSMNQGERFNYMGQELGNLGFGFGQDANQLGQLAGGFDAQGRAMGDWASGMDQFGRRFDPYAATGAVGARALGGDAAATQSLMNPYQQQVLDAVGADFNKQRALAHTQANQAATQAGAFGGDRHAVMEGARLGELDSAQLATMANLRQTGFNDAMGRAGQAANLGFGAGEMDLAGRGLGLEGRRVGQDFNQLGLGARGLGAQYDQMGLGARGMQGDMYNLGMGALGQAGQFAGAGMDASGQLMNAGDYYRNIEQQRLSDQYGRHLEERDWGLRNLGILQGGIQGMPYGTTQTTRTPSDPLGGLLGLGMTVGGMALGGPGGAAAANSMVNDPSGSFGGVQPAPSLPYQQPQYMAPRVGWQPSYGMAY